MAIIDKLLDDLLRKEGGYSNRKADRGGPTKYGVTLTTLRRHQKEATVDDLKNLTLDEAKAIFKSEFYFEPKINRLPKSLQPVVFDISVNSGPTRAINMLQQTLVSRGFVVGLIDGKIGDRTISASEKAACGDLINAIVDRRIVFMRRICINDPSQLENLGGWLNRAESFRVKQ